LSYYDSLAGASRDITGGFALIPEKNAMRDKNLILVVDDSRTVLHGTCRILQKAGYETIEASSGIDGLRLTIEHKPDLVLLDVVLPDIYGYEVCRRIKAEANLKRAHLLY
jgi:DNA-binding response OmpR family regulator